jgi:energy-coupling factor transport system ATP-binding protein
VVLDEPTTGQDAFGLQRLAALLREWTHENVTVIAVTHDIDFAAEQFSELLVMAQGQVIARGGARVLNDQTVLERAGLDAPQLVRLAHALEWQDAPMSVDAFVTHLAQFKNAD